MPLSVPQPVINSDAMTELIYFPQLISLAISFLCRVKENCTLKYQSLSLAVTMRWRLQKSENCEDATLSAEIRWNFSQLDDSDGGLPGRGGHSSKQKKSTSPGIDCFTLITLDFYAFYASTFLSCNENDFCQRFPTNKRRTLVISLSAHVITALVRWSVRRSVSKAVINVRAQVAELRIFRCESAIDMSTASTEREREQVKRKHACSFN